MRVNFAIFTGAVLSLLTVLSLPVQAQLLSQLGLLANKKEESISSIKQPLDHSKRSPLLILLAKQSLPIQTRPNLITEFAAASVGHVSISQTSIGQISTEQISTEQISTHKTAPAVSSPLNTLNQFSLLTASRHSTDNTLEKNSYRDHDQTSYQNIFSYAADSPGLKRTHKTTPKALPTLERLISINELATTQPNLINIDLIDTALVIESSPSVQTSTTNSNSNSNDIATSRTLPSLEEIQQIQQDLRNLGIPEPVRNRRRVYPGITISNPTGYGADRGQIFAGVGFQSRTRFSGGANVGTIFGGGKRDGTVGLGFGLGDARESVGFQLSYTAASFGGSREPLSGGINAKVHKQFGDRWAAAIGGEGIINFGRLPEDDDEIEFNDFEGTYYGVLTKTISLREDFYQPFSRLTLTGGIGSGRFRSVDAIVNGEFGVGVFGSAALQVLPSTSLITEWTGQDLAAGISIAPFPNFPIVFTPAIRDIAGEGDGDPRFVLGVGISVRDAIAALGL